MMQSLKYGNGAPMFEVYHYGVETSESGAAVQIPLLNKTEWQALRVESAMQLDKSSQKEAEAKIANPLTEVGFLANWSTPLYSEFNRRFAAALKANYRGTDTDIVCVPFGRAYDYAISGYTAVETGIGYNDSYLNYRIFESNAWLSYTLGAQNIKPSNYFFVIPIYFDTAEYRLSLTPRRQIGFLGRVDICKGCNIIAEIAKRFPQIDFILCGQGDPTPFLTSPNIKYKAPIHGAARSEFLGSCVATICASAFVEPFCCSNIESQLCGTPVISADTGGLYENIKQFKTGMRCHTLADYCKGVQMALDGAYDRAYIRKRAVRLYDMYNVAKQFKYVFKSILDLYKGDKPGWYSPDCHLDLGATTI